MLPSLVVALSLAAAPADLAPPVPALRGDAPRRERLVLAAPALAARRGPLRQADDYDEPQDEDDADRRQPHLILSGWGGEALAHGGSGRASSVYGGELAWVFSQLDVGLSASWFRSLADANRAWTPVVMTRVTQRFLTRRGFEAAFSLGFGAGRPSGWIGWYQVALGIRVPLGPVFVGAELSFEQYDIVRPAGIAGVGLF